MNVERMTQHLCSGEAPSLDHREVRQLLGQGYEEAVFAPGSVGRQRLVTALATRLGPNYRQSAKAMAVLAEHDRLTADTRTWLQLKESQYG